VDDPFQRLHAAMVLGLMGEQAQGGVPALVDAMRDKDPQVRRMIIAALSEIGPAAKTAVPALVGSLRDRCEAVRRRAAIALAELGPPARAAVPALVAALKDSDAMVRRWAAFALGELGPKAASAAPNLVELLRDPSVITRAIAAVALPKLGLEALPTLFKALLHSDPQVRRHAATALGRCDGDPSMVLLALRTACKDVDGEVRIAALAALKRLVEAANNGELRPLPPSPALQPVDCLNEQEA
jgi:HEAT repeat protein